MSPPRAIEMPRAITSLPWSRTFTCGGSIVAAADLGDVAELERRAGGADREAPQVVERGELAGDADLDRIGRRRDRPSGLDRVLLAELAQDLVHVEAERRQPRRGDLDEHFLVLGAEDRDLVDVLDFQQALPHLVGVVELGVAVAVGRERVDRAVDVAELVVEERADDARRQRAAQVAQLLAHRVPDLRHLLRRRGVAHLEQDQRLARLRIRCGSGRRRAPPAGRARACRPPARRPAARSRRARRRGSPSPGR